MLILAFYVTESIHQLHFNIFGKTSPTHIVCWVWRILRIGLSRERVRQVGLVALEKLKHAARKRQLDAMLVQQH